MTAGGEALVHVPTTTLADLLGRAQVMDIGIRPLWDGAPRVAGPAFTVHCPPGDNLMAHAAVHRAPSGSIVVVEAGDVDYAVAGGNVLAVARRRGIVAFVVDGVLRDLAEARELGFPVFARGVIPVPGVKKAVEPLNAPITCGGVAISAGDVVVADQEGVVVVPAKLRARILEDANAALAAESAVSLDEWEQAHRSRIDALLAERGFTD
jgi:regulator of RNase E activity RraA